MIFNRVPVMDAYVIHAFSDGSCNSNCVWCIRHYDLFKKCLVGTITYKQFENFLSLNEDCKKPLVPYGLGEPTIHKDFVPFCELALEKGWELQSIHTNLSQPHLPMKVLGTLVKFKAVTVNIGGISEKTQQLNMGTSLKETMINITLLAQLKKAYASDVEITVKMVVNKNNISDVKLIKLLSDSLPELKIKTYPVYFSVSDGSEEDKQCFFEQNLLWGIEVPCRETIVDEAGQIVVKSKLKRCYGLVPTIHVNGRVSVCCRSRWYGEYVGNAFRTPMGVILRSRAYKEAVKRAKRREYVEYCKFCS